MSRALIFDLDGTLLDSSKKIRTENQSAMLESAACGFRLIIATSRPIRTIRQFVDRDILDRCIIISLNGAIVQYPHPSARTSRFGSLGNFVSAVVSSIDRTGERPHFSIETDGNSFAMNSKLSQNELWERHSATPDMLVPLADLDLDLATKIAIDGRGKRIPNTIRIAQEFPELRFIPAENETFVNVVPLEVDKSTTLERVAEREGIDLKSSFAFGDDISDLNMFGVTGSSVAMANGTDVIKRAASVTIGNCDTDTIANFVRGEIL